VRPFGGVEPNHPFPGGFDTIINSNAALVDDLRIAVQVLGFSGNLDNIVVIIAFLLAVLVIGWFIGRLRERRRGQRGEEYLPGSHPALPTPEAKPSDLAAISGAETCGVDLVHNAPPISSLSAIRSRAEWDLWNVRPPS
jgi:hypothetical protein